MNFNRNFVSELVPDVVKDLELVGACALTPHVVIDAIVCGRSTSQL